MLQINLPAGRCPGTVSLSALFFPGACSFSLCLAVIHTPGKPWREGEREEWRTGAEEQREKVNKVYFMSGRLRFRCLEDFHLYLRSESKFRPVHVAVSDVSTPAATHSAFFQFPLHRLPSDYQPLTERTCEAVLRSDQTLKSQ